MENKFSSASGLFFRLVELSVENLVVNIQLKHTLKSQFLSFSRLLINNMNTLLILDSGRKSLFPVIHAIMRV